MQIPKSVWVIFLHTKLPLLNTHIELHRAHIQHLFDGLNFIQIPLQAIFDSCGLLNSDFDVGNAILQNLHRRKQRISPTILVIIRKIKEQSIEKSEGKNIMSRIRLINYCKMSNGVIKCT